MSNLNQIGLDSQKSAELAQKLNDLLANYSVFYQNVRGYHWNVKGDKFFELHIKFEELYNDLFVKIDEVAERILTLGYAPQHCFSNYLTNSQIQESKEVSDGMKCVGNILASFKQLLTKQRDILQLSGDINDEGTNAQMSDYIREQEKLVWMYSAYLA
ncbi:Dps family protein [Aureitalea marina]|uniref:DNA starvation/stationary phase protection protein n=1 Tax=Aureitalea marina TaxID=930804 RepID=A0A2S7KRP4_9FLAO|nr:Dps family protein [Aureitalea marina]PQB05290.1 DNA starvation/stationary phase protection protein [Aureitalea marina]